MELVGDLADKQRTFLSFYANKGSFFFKYKFINIKK